MNSVSGLILIIFSGITGGLFSLGYKQSLHFYKTPTQFLRDYSLSFFIFAIIGAAIFKEFHFDNQAFLFGILSGISMFIAVYSYFKLIAHKKLNISWTVLQFNIIIPILVSLLFFGERLHTITIIGCIFMILAIFSFGYGKNKKLGPPSNLDKSLSRLLFLASVFSGLAVSFPKFYSAGSNVSRPFLLMLISSGTMVILSFLFSIVNRNSYPTEKSIGNHWPTRAISIPLVMGFFQLASMITLTISLEAIQGAIAYPIRSLSSLLTVYIFAFILFRESFHNSEKLGVIFSMVAIGFISYAL